MATVLRYRVFSAIRNASRSCSFLKTKSPNNVRSLATAVQEKAVNPLKYYQEMSIHQCLLLVENRINTKGRLTGFELDCITHAIQNKASLQSNQVLLLIRCCGSIAMNEKPEVRMAYAQKIWNIIKASDVTLDITHYNAYLKVQMENEQLISPSECLKNIEKEGLIPNRVTYQYLLIHCCTKGDLVTATELLEKMKSHSYPLNENVFNALVMGHSMVNDINGAEGIMKIMKEKEIFITSKTYSMYLCGLAVAGNIEKMRSVMEECSKQNIEIRGSRMMDVVYYLFMNGHYDYGEELLKSLGEIQNFGEMIMLQFRLLHKKNYEGYLRTLSFISSPDNMLDRMRLAFRYLGNKEDFESVLKFKELCDQKGLNVDPLRNILYYSLLKNDSEKSLKIIEHFYKSGHTLKEAYFAPLLINASKSNDVTKLLQLITTVSYRYAFEINVDFLVRCVFDHLDFDEKRMTFFLKKENAVHVIKKLTDMQGDVLTILQSQNWSAKFVSGSSDREDAPLSGVQVDADEDKIKIVVDPSHQTTRHEIRALTVQVNSIIVSNAFLKSALKKRDTEGIRFMLNRFGLPNKIFDYVLDSMARYLKDPHDLKIVTDILSKWIRDKNQNPSETVKSQAGGGDRNDVQETIDKLAIKIFRLCSSSSITEEFLKVAEAENFPISAAVVDLIRQKSKDVAAELPGGGTSEKGFTGDFVEMHKPEETLSANDSVFGLFSKHRKAGNITEMEKIFNENESLQNNFGYRKIVESLKILNKEDSIKQYLRRYYEKFSQVDVLPRNMFMEAEMVNRGMLKEAIELISKRFSSTGLTRSSSFIIGNIFTPVFERGNENEVKELLSIQSSSGVKLISLKDIVENLVQRGSEQVAIKIVCSLDEQDLNTVDINRSLIIGLFNKKKFELMEELIKYLEDKPAFKQSGSELMFLYACTGKIAKGRELLNLDGLAPLQWMRNVSAMNSPDRMQVLENAVAISRGNEYYQIGKLYERLMEDYKMESVSPDKALDLWLQLQEENVQPTPKFLYTLAEILKKNGRDVPFQPPAERDIAIEIYVPQSFPWIVKAAVWGIKGKNGIRKGFKKLKDLLLENKLNANHISTILDLNKNMKREVRRVLEDILVLTELKRSHRSGTLPDYLQKFIYNSDEKTPEVKIMELPFRFLLSLLGLFPSEAMAPMRDVSHVVLWAHWKNCPEYSRLAEMLEQRARDLIKSEVILENLVKTLELNSFGQKHKHITSYLLAEKVFDNYEDIKMRAEDVLNSTAPPLDDVTLNASEPSSEDNFSFQNVFQDRAEGETMQSNVDSAKPVEKLESPDVTQDEKRGSGAGPNV